eukprot:3728962-Pyramimonas_sp.AAC.1
MRGGGGVRGGTGGGGGVESSRCYFGFPLLSRLGVLLGSARMHSILLLGGSWGFCGPLGRL